MAKGSVQGCTAAQPRSLRQLYICTPLHPCRSIERHTGGMHAMTGSTREDRGMKEHNTGFSWVYQGDTGPTGEITGAQDHTGVCPCYPIPCIPHANSSVPHAYPNTVNTCMPHPHHWRPWVDSCLLDAQDLTTADQECLLNLGFGGWAFCTSGWPLDFLSTIAALSPCNVLL